MDSLCPLQNLINGWFKNNDARNELTGNISGFPAFLRLYRIMPLLCLEAVILFHVNQGTGKTCSIQARYLKVIGHMNG